MSSNPDHVAEIRETEWTDGTVVCPACQASGLHRIVYFGDDGIIDADNPQHIIGASLRCWNCGQTIQSRYTREYQALIDEEEAQIERERTAAYSDYTRDESRRLAKGGYY